MRWSRRLAEARRAVEQELSADGADSAAQSAAKAQEWAVLSVLAAAGALPWLIRPAPVRPPGWQGGGRAGPDLAREVGEFVGRRGELRTWPGQLAGDGIAGVVIHGIGGIGKTTLANELAVRWADARGEVLLASHVGPAGVDAVFGAVVGAARRALIGAGLAQDPLFQAVNHCTAVSVPWQRAAGGVARARAGEDAAAACWSWTTSRTTSPKAPGARRPIRSWPRCWPPGPGIPAPRGS